MKSITRFSLKWFLRLGLFLTLFVGLFMFFLSFVHIPVTFLTKTFEKQVQEFIHNIKSLNLSFTRHGFGIEANEVELAHSEWREKLDLPRSVFYFSPKNLIKGEMIPNRISFYNPSVDVSGLLKGSGNQEGGSFKEIISQLPDVDRIYAHDLKLKNAPIALDPFHLKYQKNGDVIKAKIESPFGANYAYRVIFEINLKDGSGKANFECTNIPLALLGVEVDGALFISGKGHADFNEFVLQNLELTLGNSGKTLAFTLNGQYDQFAQKLKLVDSELVLNYMHCPVYGSLGLNGSEIECHFPEAFSTQNLKEVYPVALAKLPFEWIETNIKRGEIKDLKVQMHLSPENAFRIGAEFDFDQLEFSYFGDLPFVKKASGKGKLTSNDLAFDIKSAEINKMPIVNSKAIIFDHFSKLKVDINLAGEIQKALEIANQKPLRYIDQIGFKPSHFKGKGDYRVQLEIPLLKNVLLKDCSVGVTGHFHEIETPFKLFGAQAKAIGAELSISPDMLLINTKARIKDQEGDLIWREYFSSAGNKRREFSVNGNLSSHSLDLLDIGFFKLHQKSPFEFYYSETKQGKGSGILNYHLQNANLEVPQLNYRQKEGDALKGMLKLAFQDLNLKEISEFSLLGKDDSVKGKARFSAGKVNIVQISEMILGKTNCRLNLEGNKLDVKGKSLDISGIKLKKGNTEKLPNLNLMLDLESVFSSQGKFLQNIKGTLEFKEDKWYQSDLKAQNLDGSGLHLSIQPDGKSRTFLFSADNVGPLFESFDLLPFLASGKMLVQGEFKPSGFKGKLTGEKLKLKKVPAMVKIFSAFSIPGLMAMLTGSRIEFSKVSGEFSSFNNSLTIHALEAKGNALNLALKGEFNQMLDTLSLQGALGTSGIIDKTLGVIPILGHLLTGTDKLGMFGVKFKIQGPSSNPIVQANPLSAFTPGILRDVFG